MEATLISLNVGISAIKYSNRLLMNELIKQMKKQTNKNAIKTTKTNKKGQTIKLQNWSYCASTVWNTNQL